MSFQAALNFVADTKYRMRSHALLFLDVREARLCSSPMRLLLGAVVLRATV